MNDGLLPPGALQGVKVIDLTQMLSGPYCTMILRDLGAEVIKVEPLGGDTVRSNSLAKDDTLRAYGGYFQSINRGKKSISVDLKSDAGPEIVRRLAVGADVLVENYKAGVMDRLGLSYESLHELNPRLVYACIRGFGDPRTGLSPYADWPAFDVVAQAMGGLMSLNGPGPGQPMRIGASMGDILPGVTTALGIVAAVYHAHRTGEGQFLDVAMYDAILAICEQLAYRYFYVGEVSEPTGNEHPFFCPFGVYPTSDGAVTIAAPLDHHWRQLCLLMGRNDLAEDESLTHNIGRAKDPARVRAEITAWTSVHTRDEVVATLSPHLPCGPVNSIVDIVNDPHVAARGMLPVLEHPGMEREVRVPSSPIKMTATPAGVRGRAPFMGEHTDDVLASLGYSPDEIVALREVGAIR